MQQMPLYAGPPPGIISPPSHSHPPPLGGANTVPVGPAAAASGGSGHDTGWAGRQQMKTQKATTLFVGSIPNGVTDRWIKMLFEVSRLPSRCAADDVDCETEELVMLTARPPRREHEQTCGQIASFNRPNKAFCFIEFSEPDSVLRALTTLNELELPGLPHGHGHPSKKLKVKADAKTGQFLEEWKAKRDGARDGEHDARASAQIGEVLRRMRDPHYQLPLDPGEARPAYETPAHLKDLTEEELPEEVRGSVLGEIAQFRVTASAREEDKRKREAELARIRQQEQEQARLQQQQQEQAAGDSSRAGPSGSGGGAYEGAQSYRRPVGFVQPTEINGKRREDMDPEERDELEERLRKQKLEEDRQVDAQIAENKYLAKERVRMAKWEKEAERDRLDETRKADEAARFRRRCERWDAEREPFYFERSRWRRQRQGDLAREEAADERDAAEEAAQEEKAKAEAERFLKKQEEEMRKLAEEQRAAGVLLPGAVGSGSLKLTIAQKNLAKEDDVEGAGSAAAAESAAAKVAPALKVSLDAAEEDDIGLRRKKLAKINFNDNKSEAELRVLRADELRRIRAQLPKDVDALLAMTPEWELIQQVRFPCVGCICVGNRTG